MPDSPDFPTRSSGLVRGIVIVLAVVVVAGGIVTSAVLTPPAATAPAATAPADPLTSRLDYQTSDFTQWTEQHLLRSEQEAIVSSPARSGYPRTARFIVAPGDHTSGRSEVERAEVAASAAQTGDPGEGKDKWFAWSSFFPAGTRVDEPDGWLVFTQWHQSGTTGVPNIGGCPGSRGN